MHVQTVTYRLNGISEDEYLDMADAVTTRFTAMGGLLAKLWLEGTDDGTFGSVYFWADAEAMERFSGSDLFEGTSSEFADVTSTSFTVLENLTRATQPVMDIVGPRARPAQSQILGRDPAEGSPEVPGGRAASPMAKASAKSKATPGKAKTAGKR